MKGPFWNYLETKTLGSSRWHFYLIASRRAPELGLTKGWAWDKVMGNYTKESEKAFGAGVTWHFLFTRSFDQNPIWIRLQGWCLKKVWNSTLKFWFKSALCLNKNTSWTFTQINWWVSCRICSAAYFQYLLFMMTKCNQFLLFLPIIPSLKLGAAFWLIDKASTLPFKLLLKTNFRFHWVKQCQVGKIGW